MKLYRKVIGKNFFGILGVVILSITDALTMVLAGYSLSFLFTAYEYEGDKAKALLLTFGIVLGIWLVAMGIYYFDRLARTKIREKIKNDLRTIAAEKIASLEYGEFVEKDCGNYVSWLTNDVEEIYNQSFASLFSGIESFATTVFSFGALCLLSPYIGIAAAVLLVVIIVLPQLTGRKLQKANEERSKAMEVSTESYKDVISGGTIFFIANLRQRICERISAASIKAEKAVFKYNKTNVSVQMLVSTVSMVAQVILLLVSLLASVMGAATAGATLSVGNLAGAFFNGVSSFMEQFMTVKASKPLWEKFKKDSAQSEEKADISEIQKITLSDVSFNYGDRAVLKNCNYTFREGGKYAIMGESGSGKTTLTKIMLGLLPEYTGEVRYGDLEQREINLPSLYRNIAYVEQQVYLFCDTVRFNITLGQPYTDEEVMAVIKKCRLEEFIDSLPDGLDTVIYENGKNLSGGQRQRIALARGLIRKVQYIILDEGTSALDESNAVDIENSLMEYEDMGVIIITHNLRDCVKSKLTDIYSLTA